MVQQNYSKMSLCELFEYFGLKITLLVRVQLVYLITLYFIPNSRIGIYQSVIKYRFSYCLIILTRDDLP